ncbi:ras-related protein Rab-28-like [Xenia sp. Carnegie-2017]|uniref:ras-related protein Rab-28-like n=1 Tax=Xenia sp. Carnegie-2017 TaxID=2897299 RepID=UPI001F0460CB|nr:ras-related protein Rab-28-like [Xenia sp. Carnegie-2017]
MSDSEEEAVNEHQLKFVLVGDGTAGKTSIAVRYTSENFDQAYKQTIGLDFFLKRIVLAGNVNVSIQLWDIGGQTIGGKMIDTYLSGAKAILFVYDITNQSTFDNLEDWWETVKSSLKEKDPSSMPVFALIANKGDLEHMRVVKQNHHDKFAKEHAMSSHCLSAKSGDQVKMCFQRIAADVLGIRLTKNELEKTNQVLKAGVVQYANNEIPSRQASQQKSSICSVQ